MTETIKVDGDSVEVQEEDTVEDVKAMLSIPEDEILHGQIDGEMTPLNNDDPIKIVEDPELSTMPSADGSFYGQG